MKYLLIICASLLLWGCSDKTEKVEEVKNEISLPSNLFSVNNIEGAVPVLEARKLKAGDQVKVTGKIMGNRLPFIESRAAFIIGDPAKLISCDLKPDDPCEEPWDVCCEENDDIAAATLNVQVVDSNGKVFKTGIEGKGGLKKLSIVVIEGVVAKNTTEKAMTINAEKIYVKK